MLVAKPANIRSALVKFFIVEVPWFRLLCGVTIPALAALL